MDKPRGYKRTKRFTKRLEVTFRAGGLDFRGILSDVSDNGIFIRTNRGFAPNTTLDIELVLPDNTVSHMKGIVRRTIKTPLAIKNGMGVELTEKDAAFEKFVKTFYEDTDTEKDRDTDTQTEEPPSPPEYQIISCPQCGVKNKVPQAKIAEGPLCGKCKTPLVIAT